MKKLSLFLVIFFIISIYHSQAKTIRYVKVNGTGDGSSWINASGSVQTMIDNSALGDEVWLAKGTYYPTTETIARDSRSRTFTISYRVNIYGGFAGNENEISQRLLSDLDLNGKIDPYEFINQSILSGDIDGVVDSWVQTYSSDAKSWNWAITGNENNSYTVVAGTNFIIDGVTFYGGNANTLSNNSAGGISCTNSIIRNCIVSNCFASSKGGGILSSAISPSSYISQVKNCKILNCSATDGGGIYTSDSYVDNCSFSNCSATTGGGIFSYSSFITNNTITNCTASASGGGIYYIASFSDFSYLSHVSNCTLHSCSALNGGGIYSTASYFSNYKNSNSHVDNCKISNCFASLNGGGVFTSASDYYYTKSYVENCTVSNCSAITGGGIYSYSSAVSTSSVSSNVTNCVVSNCSAITGGGIFSTYYKSTIPNSYVTNCVSSNNNSNGIIGSGLSGGTQSGCTSPDINLSFNQPTSFTGIAATSAQETEIHSADWRLKESSSCINAGTTTNISSSILTGIDLENNPRVVYGNIDIGAYEYVLPKYQMPFSEDFDSLFNWNSSKVFYNSAQLDGGQSIKWSIINQKAVFNWQTNLTSNYSCPFFTYQIDATNLAKVYLHYDMYFQAYAGSISPLGTEKLNIEYSIDFITWSTIATYSNANGTIVNQTYKHDLSSKLAGKKFFIRFNANGANSNRIEKWELDNVYIDANGTNASNLIQESKYKYFVNNGCVIIGDLEYGALVQLYDVNGKIINSKRNESESIQFTLPVQGVYIVKILNNSVVESKKIIW